MLAWVIGVGLPLALIAFAWWEADRWRQQKDLDTPIRPLVVASVDRALAEIAIEALSGAPKKVGWWRRVLRLRRAA